MKSMSKWRQALLNLLKVDNTPHKISLGLSLGVVLGILPASGLVATLVLASFLKVNRTSAIIGMLLTNTWLTVITFFLSLKLGSAILGIEMQELSKNWFLFLKNFRWEDLLRISLLKLILPIIIGYLLLALGLGVITYIITRLIFLRTERKK